MAAFKPLLKKLGLAMGILFLLAVLLIISLILFAAYRIHLSQTTAEQFCQTVATGQPIDAILQKANVESMHHHRYGNERSEIIHEFFVPGFIYSFTTCTVQESSGKVLYKKVIKNSD